MLCLCNYFSILSIRFMSERVIMIDMSPSSFLSHGLLVGDKYAHSSNENMQKTSSSSDTHERD